MSYLTLRTWEVQCVCLTNFIWHWTSNPKCHMSFSNKIKCQLTSTFSSKMSPQCHMLSNSWHFNLWSVNLHVVYSSQVTLHLKNVNCVCQLTCILIIFVRVLACQIEKNLQKLCDKYTPLGTRAKPAFTNLSFLLHIYFHNFFSYCARLQHIFFFFFFFVFVVVVCVLCVCVCLSAFCNLSGSCVLS